MVLVFVGADIIWYNISLMNLVIVCLCWFCLC